LYLVIFGKILGNCLYDRLPKLYSPDHALKFWEFP
jgi:hypothetical protein